MLENVIGEITLASVKVPNGLVVGMGVGTVFLGLICIVIICKILSAILAPKKKNTVEQASAPASVQADKPAVIENRGEIVAAVSAVIAEELGTDVSAIRIHSFKKI